MTKLVLPDLSDIHGIVADYMDSVVPADRSVDERAKIIANCTKPFSLLISAWEIVDRWGDVERSIWIAFMQDIVLCKMRCEPTTRRFH